MSEQFSHNSSTVPGQANTDVVALIKKMQQQLDSLEKKIDTLIRQSQERPFREKHFSKPYRSSGRPNRPGHHYDKRDQGEDSRERSFHSGHHFEKRQGDENRGFGGPKKGYRDDRENSFSQDRHFKEKYGGKKRGFDPRKNLFFHKRKNK